MTKSERRKARKTAQAHRLPPMDELTLDRGPEPIEFSESPQGYLARERWARAYDELNGAPEDDWDR